MTQETKKKTIVSRRISRKIQTKQYESAEITIECQDEIEWTSVEDRQSKLRKVTQLAILDFQETYVSVCEALGIEKKTAFIQSDKQINKQTEDTGQKQEGSIEDMFDGLSEKHK